MSEPVAASLEWRRPFVLIVGVVLFTVAAMALLNMGPETLLVASMMAFAGTATWCVRSLAETTPIPVAPPRAFAPPRAVGADSRVKSLRHGILFGRSMSGYNDRMLETLTEIIDDQLAHGHDLDRALAPDQAANVLGPELTALVTAPNAAETIADPQALARIITLIEEI